jgi:hypothetical protein
MAKKEIRIDTTNGVTWMITPIGAQGSESSLNLEYDNKKCLLTVKNVTRIYLVETIGEAASIAPVAVPASEAVPAPVSSGSVQPEMKVIEARVLTAEDMERMKAGHGA